jgi:outer membrane protein OmpA-like peptidoglycan-associated protein
MKYLPIMCCCLLAFQLQGQKQAQKKPATIDFHVFYNDFSTAQLIRTTSLKNVVNNNLWSRFSNMQMGLGFSYLKGISPKIDVAATVDGSYADYLFQNNTVNGSSRFLFTAQAAANLKLLSDKNIIVPFVTGGAGLSLYNGKAGFYLPAGLGIQFNVFNEAFVFTNAQYRIALSKAVNCHFNYSIGIGTPINRKKTVKAKKELPPVPVADTIKKTIPEPVEIKLPAKNIVVTVTDEATGQPLPYAEVTISGPEGKRMTGITDPGGRVSFNEVSAADYTVTGILNNISAASKNITKDSFSNESAGIEISITHNDPRFTLSGNVVNKISSKPEAGVDVTVTNETQSSINIQQSKPGDGSFKAQLEANSDFTIAGKKASYLSNIEKLSTIGLNRSTTLYLKLELEVQEVTALATIVLNKIYFETGKSALNTVVSTDLNILIQFLQDNPALRLEIQGHTDNIGSVEVNNSLSQRRANSVIIYLIGSGIEKARLIAKGYGAANPVSTNATAAGRASNRRVEMKLIE